MSATWDSSAIHLARQCDAAVTFCQWCENYGHELRSCELYRAYLVQQSALVKPPLVKIVRVKASLWSWVLVFALGLIAGICIKGILG